MPDVQKCTNLMYADLIKHLKMFPLTLTNKYQKCPHDSLLLEQKK